MEYLVKHLEFIQNTIARMAHNSFLIKGWTITITGGLLALSFKEIDPRYIFISVTILILFWSIDGYYLSKERLFRKLFDDTRQITKTEVNFSMSTQPYESKYDWLKCAMSPTLVTFYGALLLTNVLIVIIL